LTKTAVNVIIKMILTAICMQSL